jgi:hypothetical protein
VRHAAIVCLTIVMVFGVRADAPAAQKPLPIFGINLSMYGPGAPDQFVDDPATHELFASLGIPFIRIPIRQGVSDARLRFVMRSVARSGAVPVVILHGASVGSPLPVDLHLLSLVRSVFGSRRVYLEFGNEEDSNGISAVRYTRMWNLVVPRLRSQSPSSYVYGGPVAFMNDVAYITSFVRHASPRPDFISWHEYVCSAADSDAYCEAHIARWAVHVRRTNTALRRAIGRSLPIMITEWNLDPNPDPRYQRPGFIEPWTIHALTQLQQLGGQGLIGAMYYTATSNADELVTSGRRLTAEGSAWWQALPSPTSSIARRLAR